MYTEINNKIYDLQARLRTKEKLESLKIIIEDELNKKEKLREDLEEQLKKEEKDVLKLENTSFSSIFLSLIGKKDEKLDKEKEEYLIAKLQYEECNQSIKEKNKELTQAADELKKYVGIEEEMEMLIKEKERLILEEDSDRGRKLKENLDRLNELKLNRKEVEEAISAGNNAKESLSRMKEKLDSAHGWGIWDMLGGGLISNIAKHSNIDEANEISHEVQRDLRSFQKELSDINEYTDLKVNLSSFATFADFFFDGFFADYFVQTKINESIDNVNSLEEKIYSLLNNLKINLSSIIGEQNTLEAHIKKILDINWQ